MLTEEQMMELVAQKFNQKAEGTVEGPHGVGRYRISRVWTRDRKDFYHAHYLIEDNDKVDIHQNFPPFALWLAEEGFNLDRSAVRRGNLVKLGVATVVVLVALGVFVFQIVMERDNSVVTYLMTTIVGGGAGYLFGNWSKGTAGAPALKP